MAQATALGAVSLGLRSVPRDPSPLAGGDYLRPDRRGFLSLAVVLDASSDRIVGWSLAANLHTDLVLGALEMALAQRRPRGIVHHSDRGSQ